MTTSSPIDPNGEAGAALRSAATDYGMAVLSKARMLDNDVPVLLADKTDEIADRLIVASIAVSRLSEVGADRAMLVQQILGQQGAVDYEGETIV